ncbi:hypothetical protein [Streptomyces cylindrosporus]|uniref:Tail assembly chaperone n=1 Tax=Streptomyces cylindrosporus TaxID=2927583 RepID=A0ABS9Y3Z1_9ACTN|nr:hypothetical protein [Streptomyces cylindrosporus]MCI3271391.1 hypothetical protein [Streptomyces cylindrosporus]
MTARKSPVGESWDAFWAEVSSGRTEVIRGVEVQVPNDMPLIVERRVEELQDSSRSEDVEELVKLIFGTDCMEHWREAGMGLKEFQTVLTWGLAHASGREMTFAEAYELVQNGEGASGGKATPNRAARRAPSASGGGRSKRTSSVSTASTRTRSQT